MRHISRIDAGNTHCYTVRFQKKDGMPHKTFSDGVWGGKRKALRAARDWRDYACKVLKRTPDERDIRGPVTSDIRNKTGVIGVHLTTKIKNGVDYPSFRCQWQFGPISNRKSKTRHFSIDAYGYGKAFRMAVRARYEGLGKPVPRGIKVPDL